jgi:hypothetical protein
MEEELKFKKHKEELLSSLGLLADFPADLRYALCCYFYYCVTRTSFKLHSYSFRLMSLAFHFFSLHFLNLFFCFCLMEPSSVLKYLYAYTSPHVHTCHFIQFYWNTRKVSYFPVNRRFWSHMALALLVAISGPKKVSISHPFQCPS